MNGNQLNFFNALCAVTRPDTEKREKLLSRISSMSDGEIAERTAVISGFMERRRLASIARA